MRLDRRPAGAGDPDHRWHRFHCAGQSPASRGALAGQAGRWLRRTVPPGLAGRDRHLQPAVACSGRDQQRCADLLPARFAQRLPHGLGEDSARATGQPYRAVQLRRPPQAPGRPAASRALRSPFMSACGCDGNNLRPVDEAIAELLARAPAPPPVERVTLNQALGRVLAEPLYAPFEVPAWDNSAMDGYALRAADLPAAGGWLPLAGRIAAGDAAAQALPAGHAVRIFTGAPLPPGADSVVMQIGRAHV